MCVCGRERERERERERVCVYAGYAGYLSTYEDSPLENGGRACEHGVGTCVSNTLAKYTHIYMYICIYIYIYTYCIYTYVYRTERRFERGFRRPYRRVMCCYCVATVLLIHTHTHP